MPELIDICDNNGHPTGETMVRAEAHRTEAWHGIVLIWLYNSEGDILLQRRAAHLNAFPECWDVTVAGHIASGESALPTAVRELGEELGIYVETGELETVGEYTDSFPLVYGKIHNEYDHLYLLKQDVDVEKLRLQAAEVLEVRWITPDALERDLADPQAAGLYSSRNPKIYQAVIDAARQQAKADQASQIKQIKQAK